MKTLLLQLRRPGDRVAAHEVTCIRRRLGARAVELDVRNALVDAAAGHWLDGCDAVIIGGSGDFSVHHPSSQPWVNPLRHLLEVALRRGLPGFAICFGHQLLGLHLGARVVTDADRTEIGTFPVEMTPCGRQDAVFGHLGEAFQAHFGHSDHVVEVPPSVDLLAQGSVVATQAFRVRGAPFYSTQFHPDLSGSEARDRYLVVRAALRGVGPRASLAQAASFRHGQDESNVLLGAFFDEVAAQHEPPMALSAVAR